MNRIQILSDDIINQIAAGEVVERPASALKELVDNALDAGATWVHVELEKGGLDAIIVRDDGCGMDIEDARLCLKRHATSKIRSFDDLFTVTSMGFRGEALAAISAVSQLTLTTVRQGSDTGVKMVGQGDQEAFQELAWAGSPGTTVAVYSLFHNVPARAKFLKSPAVEYGYCLELIHAMALCYPHVGFSLKHQGKEQFRVPPRNADVSFEGKFKGESSLKARAKVVMGKEASQLLYVTREGRFASIEALVSPPGLDKGSGKCMYFFVNNRLVKDKVMRQALLRGYHSHLPVGRFPWAVVHLTVDPSVVDVNVHPAKTEVRFQYAQEIHQLIADAVRESLRQGASSWSRPEVDESELSLSKSSAMSSVEENLFPSSTRLHHGAISERSSASGWKGAVAAAAPAKVTRQVFDLDREAKREGSIERPWSSDVGGRSLSEPLTLQGDLKASGEPAFFAGIFSSKDLTSDSVKQRAFDIEHVQWDKLEFVGSFAQCYLIFRNREALLFVDQHAFHERILYEKMVQDIDSRHESQTLLVPEGVDLPPSEVEMLMEEYKTLYRLGFDFKRVGPGTVEILAVPPILVGRDLGKLFTDLAGAQHGDVTLGVHPKVSELSHDLLAKIACHGAVRAGEDLMPGELRQLLVQAQDVDFYHNCPHGRRVFRWWKKNQVAEWFDR